MAQHQLCLTEEKLRERALALVTWGEQQKMTPEELTITLRMVSDFLAAQMGMIAKLTRVVDDVTH